MALTNKSSAPKSMNVWIVIPAFRESKIIRSVVEKVRAKYPNVVVVDDASGDMTGTEARAGGAVVLRHLINRGQGAALRTGLIYALQRGADAMVTFDADGQHQADDIDRVLGPIESGQADVVLGSRFLSQGSEIPPLRRMVLQAGVVFTRIFSGIKV